MWEANNALNSLQGYPRTGAAPVVLAAPGAKLGQVKGTHKTGYFSSRATTSQPEGWVL